MKALVYRGPGKKTWEDVPSPRRSGVRLRFQDLWIHSITISMGLVNTNSTPMLLKLVAERKLDVDKFASHHFELTDALAAFDTFGRAAETKALKVVIER